MRRALGLTCMAALVLLSAAGARAEPMPARDTARVLEPKKWGAGLLSPLAVGLGGGWELDTMLVPWFLLSPNGSVRVELGRLGRDVVVTGQYSFAVPTGAMRLTKGYLFPTWETSGKNPGWFVTPGAGLWISGGARGVWTVRLETVIGVPLGHNDASPLETFAPVELVFAPALNGFRARVGGAYDYPILDWLRARAALDGYMIGASPYPPRSPLYVSAELGLEVGLGKTLRLALGGVWYNYDARAKSLEKDDQGHSHRVGVRSNDFYPTFDIILRPR